MLLVSGPLSLHAQPQPDAFDHLTTADGLATNSVNTIFQDAQGFMWFGTDKGLHKYDGYRFTIYRHDEDDPHSLSDDRVLAVVEDRAGMLWIGTWRGLNRFDPATQRFTRYRHDPDDPNRLNAYRILSLHEDRAGLLWVGTSSGLNRLDRTTGTFTRYLHDVQDSTSIGGNSVSRILEDQAGRLWFGTWNGGGLNRFDRATETFIRYRPQNVTYHREVFRTLDLLESAERRLAALVQVGDNQDLSQSLTLTEPTQVLVVCVGEGLTTLEDYGWIENRDGAIVWEMALAQTKHAGGAEKNLIQVDLLTLPPGAYTLRYKSDYVHAYNTWNALPPRPERWGLQVLRVTREEARHIKTYVDQYERPNALSGNVFDLYEDQRGNIWIGNGWGLDRLDPETDTFTHYGDTPNDRLSDGPAVEAIEEDRNGILWIGSGSETPPFGLDALIRFDPRTGAFHPLPNDPAHPGGFQATRVRDIYEDRTGMLWIATLSHGLYTLDSSAATFTTYRHDPREEQSLSHPVVWAVHEDRDGALWIGTEDGLNRLDRQTGRLTVYTPASKDPGSLSHHHVKALLEDRNGVLWVGTYGGGLNRFDRATETFSSYRHDPIDSTTISSDTIEGLYEDQDGTLWASTWDAGWVSGLHRFDRATGTFTRYLYDPTDSTGLGHPYIKTIYEDQSGNFWVGTGDGLDRFDRKTGRFTHYLYDTPGAVVALYEDRAGRLWLSRSDGRVYRFDRETGQAEALTGRGALPQSNVEGLVGDDAGNLWFSTADNGLLRVNPDAETVRAYDLSDGLPSLDFNRGAVYQSESGEIFFGSRDGVVAFHPEQIRDNPHAPPVVLTGFTVQSRAVPVGPDAPLRAHLSVAEAVTLTYDQNDFTFEFAALNYINTEKNRYAYRLEGYDENWIEAGTSRQARYTNIPPGDYVFRVKGSNNDGVWNEEGASIRVTIQPAFWQTAWFRLLVLAAIAGLLAAAYRYRVAHLLKMERMRLRIAGDLHDDIGSKLSSIALMSEMVRDQAPLPPDQRAELSRIGVAARQIVDTLRDIVWFIDPEHDRPGDFVEKMQRTAATMFNGTTYTFACTDGALLDGTDMERRRNVFLIYKEALHNVVTHAQAETVAITVSNGEGTFPLTVQDDGVGFDPETVAGGHGLKNMQRRADELGARLEIRSHPGEGTTISLVLPE